MIGDPMESNAITRRSVACDVIDTNLPQYPCIFPVQNKLRRRQVERVLSFSKYMLTEDGVAPLADEVAQAILQANNEMAGQAIGNMRIADIDHVLLKNMFFSFIMVQSIGGGLLGGFMTDGNLSSGVRYGFILVLVSFFIFKFMF